MNGLIKHFLAALFLLVLFNQYVCSNPPNELGHENDIKTYYDDAYSEEKEISNKSFLSACMKSIPLEQRRFLVLDGPKLRTTATILEEVNEEAADAYPKYVDHQPQIPIEIPQLSTEDYKKMLTSHKLRDNYYRKNSVFFNVDLKNKSAAELLIDDISKNKIPANCVYLDYMGTLGGNLSNDHYPMEDLKLYTHNLKKHNINRSVLAITLSLRTPKPINHSGSLGVVEATQQQIQKSFLNSGYKATLTEAPLEYQRSFENGKKGQNMMTLIYTIEKDQNRKTEDKERDYTIFSDRVLFDIHRNEAYLRYWGTNPHDNDNWVKFKSGDDSLLPKEYSDSITITLDLFKNFDYEKNCTSPKTRAEVIKCSFFKSMTKHAISVYEMDFLNNLDDENLVIPSIFEPSIRSHNQERKYGFSFKKKEDNITVKSKRSSFYKGITGLNYKPNDEKHQKQYRILISGTTKKLSEKTKPRNKRKIASNHKRPLKKSRKLKPQSSIEILTEEQKTLLTPFIPGINLEEKDKTTMANNCLAIGKCFFEGKGVPKNDGNGIFFIDKAHSNGNSDATNYLADYYANNPNKSIIHIRNIISYNEQAADQGYVQAQIRLGDYYYEGKYELLKNKKKAQELWMKAAAQGNTTALIKLGDLYLDYSNAFIKYRWVMGPYRQIPALVTPQMLLNFANLHAKGERGAQKNFKKAVTFLDAAAALGNLDAIYSLGKIYLEGGNGIDQNLVVGDCYCF